MGELQCLSKEVELAPGSLGQGEEKACPAQARPCYPILLGSSG